MSDVVSDGEFCLRMEVRVGWGQVVTMMIPSRPAPWLQPPTPHNHYDSASERYTIPLTAPQALVGQCYGGLFRAQLMTGSILAGSRVVCFRRETSGVTSVGWEIKGWSPVTS